MFVNMSGYTSPATYEQYREVRLDHRRREWTITLGHIEPTWYIVELEPPTGFLVHAPWPEYESSTEEGTTEDSPQLTNVDEDATPPPEASQMG